MYQHTDNFVPKNPPMFSCSKCDYVTYNVKDYKKHVRTIKHMTDATAHTVVPKPLYLCVCGNKYKHRQSLYNHKRKYKCSSDKETTNESEDSALVLLNTDNPQQLIHSLIKDNAEFKQLMIEQNNYFKELMQKGQHNTTNITSNTVNNSFNLQVFLNETCKNAMNIMDFVSQLQVDISDV